MLTGKSQMSQRHSHPYSLSLIAYERIPYILLFFSPTIFTVLPLCLIGLSQQASGRPTDSTHTHTNTNTLYLYIHSNKRAQVLYAATIENSTPLCQSRHSESHVCNGQLQFLFFINLQITSFRANCILEDLDLSSAIVFPRYSFSFLHKLQTGFKKLSSLSLHLQRWYWKHGITNSTEECKCVHLCAWMHAWCSGSCACGNMNISKLHCLLPWWVI